MSQLSVGGRNRCFAGRQGQRGMSVIILVFLLVVLGALAGIVTKLSTTEHFAFAYSQRASQAYFAARAGMDYANARLSSLGGCGTISTALTIEGYSVTISCAISGSANEGAASNYSVYDLEVTASRGSFGVPDVSNRRLRATVKWP